MTIFDSAITGQKDIEAQILHLAPVDIQQWWCSSWLLGGVGFGLHWFLGGGGLVGAE